MQKLKEMFSRTLDIHLLSILITHFKLSQSSSLSLIFALGKFTIYLNIYSGDLGKIL
jgi:hypothetical protein